MSERQLQFRVGLFVSLALASIVGLIFQFGEIQRYLRPKYTVNIRFKSATGIAVSTPVRRNGVLIGSVTAVHFDDENGGLIVRASIKDGVRLWPDGRVRLVSSLLGDSAIEFLPGKSKQALKDGDTVEAEPAVDPLNVVARMEQNVALLIDSFQQTSHEWQTVGHNLNSVLQTNQGNLHTVVARAAEALTEVAHTMKTVDQTLQDASRLIGDPQTQENLRKTMNALPVLADETQRTVAAVRVAVQKMDENLSNLNAVTAPLGEERRHAGDAHREHAGQRRNAQRRADAVCQDGQQPGGHDPQAGGRPAALREPQPLGRIGLDAVTKSRAGDPRSARFQRQGRPTPRADRSQRRAARQFWAQGSGRRVGTPADAAAVDPTQ